MSIGSDSEVLSTLRHTRPCLLLLPLCTLGGTLAGCLAVSLFLPDMRLTDCFAIGSGFGYYSLSSIFITQYRGAALGTVALLANIVRELLTLLCSPLLARWFGPLAPISVGGATSMDTTLPIITRYSGKALATLSVFHGRCVTCYNKAAGRQRSAALVCIILTCGLWTYAKYFSSIRWQSIALTDS